MIQRDPTVNVFAYGTLQFPEIWMRVAGIQLSPVRAMLPGYAIYRIKDAVYPGIVPAPGDSLVTGVVYLGVHEVVVERLDQFEDDCYVRTPVSVMCADGTERGACAYVVQPSHRHILTDEPWRPEEFIARGHLRQFIDRYGGFGRLLD